MQQIPRLYVDTGLGEGQALGLDPQKTHYLRDVLRLAPGEEVRLFDDRSGEWRATVAEIGRKGATLMLRERLAPREETPDLWLVAAPLRPERFFLTVEKATEMGVRRIVPVLTARCNHARLNRARLFAHMIEAAEQCGRTALPELAPLQPLPALLADWPMGRALFFADEEGGTPMADLAPALPAAILIGPEGGFADEERRLLLAQGETRRLALGPRVLRADTAAVAALAQFQLVAGG